MTTATPARARSTGVQSTSLSTPEDVAASFRAIIAELSNEFFERRAVIEALIISILARHHAFVLGPPGTAKSDMLRSICRRIVGGKFWSVLFDRELDKEEIFGPRDLPAYDKRNVWERDVEDSIVDCHLAFGDEVGKAGPAVLNKLLTALMERQFKNGKTWVDLPLVTFVGASNEMLETELAAFWDRFMVRVKVDYIQEPGHFAALLGTSVHKGTAQTPTTVTLADLENISLNVIPTIVIPPGVIDTVQQLRLDLAEREIKPSDRRWKQSMRLVQAAAFLAGRTVADEDDLAILAHVLWDVERQIPEVEAKVLSLSSEFTRAALEIEKLIDEWTEGVDSRRGQDRETRASYGGEIQWKIKQKHTDLIDLIERANREGRTTTKLEGVRDRLRGLKAKVYVECMEMDEERATRIVQKDLGKP
jgi:MoxR-like ATPase